MGLGFTPSARLDKAKQTADADTHLPCIASLSTTSLGLSGPDLAKHYSSSAHINCQGGHVIPLLLIGRDTSPVSPFHLKGHGALKVTGSAGGSWIQTNGPSTSKFRQDLATSLTSSQLVVGE